MNFAVRMHVVRNIKINIYKEFSESRPEAYAPRILEG